MSNAKVHEYKTEEARTLSVKRCINEPGREGAEQLFQQLPYFCSKSPRPLLPPPVPMSAHQGREPPPAAKLEPCTRLRLTQPKGTATAPAPVTVISEPGALAPTQAENLT